MTKPNTLLPTRASYQKRWTLRTRRRRRKTRLICILIRTKSYLVILKRGWLLRYTWTKNQHRIDLNWNLKISRPPLIWLLWKCCHLSSSILLIHVWTITSCIRRHCCCRKAWLAYYCTFWHQKIFCINLITSNTRE